ncbi:MAG TPA: ATP-binding cassette domain-containing protein [Egibacteraceae bacterium]
MTAIEAVGLTKSYGDTPVLQGIDLAVPHGTVWALLGPNGAGKTTLVRILTTLTRPDGGTARVEGRDVVRDPLAVRRTIGLTGQQASVDDLLTGEENLLLTGRLLHLDRATSRRRAAELLERFDLVAAARRQVRTYSGGMRRRLDLAASLMAAPPVLVLDEPTTGLDPRSRRTLWDVIRGLVDDGITILLTTQYLEEADQLADRVALLHGGRIVTEGTPRALKRQVGEERLTLTFATAADATRAAAAVQAGAAARGAATVRRSGGAAVGRADGATLSLPLRDSDHLREVLDRVAAADLRALGVDVSAPTLDDVFLTLTSDDDRADARRDLEVAR